MLNKPIQEVLHEKVISLTILIPAYFRTLLALLVNPKVMYEKFSAQDAKSEWMNPGVFLISNILIAHSIEHFFGHDIPKFPFNAPILNLFSGFPFLILRYILGTLLFIAILKLFIKQNQLELFIHKVFPIICYASAIYVPYGFIHGLSGGQVGEYMLNVFPNILQNISGRTILVFYIKILFFIFTPYVIFIVWWLRVIYLGLKASGLSPSINIKKAIIVSPVIFIIIQFSTFLTASYIVNASTFDALNVVYSGSIDEIMSQESPNYFRAMFLAEKVSDNKQMPEYGRYAYRVVKISSAIAMVARNDKTMVAKILKGIKNHEYEYVEKIIRNNADSLSAIIDLKKELLELETIRNSPTFIDLKGMTITLSPFTTKYVDNLESSTPDLIRIDEKNYLYVCPITIVPAFISIFP